MKFLLPHQQWVHFSRPYGTEIHSLPNPGVETPGYLQASLRDAVYYNALAAINRLAIIGRPSGARLRRLV